MSNEPEYFFELESAETLKELTRRFTDFNLIRSTQMSFVVKAFDEAHREHVAFKIPRKACQNDESYMTRFMREALVLDHLKHPHIVKLHSYAVFMPGQERTSYLCMEHVDGTDLLEVLLDKPDIHDPNIHQQFLTWITQVTDASQAAHQAGYVHRDIKPENILVSRENCLKLIDFGTVYFKHRNSTSLGLVDEWVEFRL